MRRALIFFCLAAGCGLPDLDTPATRADGVAPYPMLAPRGALLSRVEADIATEAGADLVDRSAGLTARGDATRAQGSAVSDRTGILDRADELRSRAQGVRDLGGTVDAAAASDLRQRAASIRADQDPPAATVAPPEPAESDEDAAERLRRLRLLRDGNGDDPL